MASRVTSFSARGKSTLQVFCPDPQTIVTAFESHLPEGKTIYTITGTDPCLPAAPCWLKQGYEYFAFLPKERFFDGHLLASLNNRRPLVQRGSRWHMDDETCDLWRSLDVNLTNSITVIGKGLLFDLEHYEPGPVVRYGFARGHKTERHLRLSLSMSKRAFVHKVAYLSYLASRRHQWDRDLVGQTWLKELSDVFSRTWIDSILDTIHRRRAIRNFIGVVVKPGIDSVRWLDKALKFGVPIWVMIPDLGAYDGLDGGFVMKQWQPTAQEIHAGREAQRSKLAALATPTVAAPPSQPPTVDPEPEDCPTQPDDPALELPTTSKTLSPPEVLPHNARWYESWQDFFQRRDKANARRLEVATETQKTSWESRTRNARKFRQPGRRGALVYEWSECDSGGFFRTLQTRYQVSLCWEDYCERALIYDPQQDTWDHCPFAWKPAVENGPPDDFGEDEDEEPDHVAGSWYAEPISSETLPDRKPDPLDFLYQRYGFLATEPTTLPTTTLLSAKSNAYRIIGLDAQDSGRPPRYLNDFITKILQRELPAGHCDLSPTCPPEETFPDRRSIRDTVVFLKTLCLSDEGGFVFLNNQKDSTLLAVHEALSVLQLVRTGTRLELEAVLGFLTQNGCRFTLLYPNALELTPPKFYPFTFPLRHPGWQPDAEDYRAYMSRLVTFFNERPNVVAAALSRGGIAWRIVVEVLGIKGSVEELMDTLPEQRCSVKTSQGTRWCHELDEGEWFYLVGGYEVLTGPCVFFGKRNRA